MLSNVDVDALIVKARRQGFVTYDDITGLFPDMDSHSGDVDALCMQLVDMGVEIVWASRATEVVKADGGEQKPAPAEEPQRPGLVDDAYELYMAEIRRIPLLSAEDEVALGKLIRKGQRARSRLEQEGMAASERDSLEADVRQGEQARQRFIEANLRLAARVAWTYRSSGMPLLDLIEEANIGLIKAVDRWDYRRGYRFSTYGIWWIRQAISRAVAEDGMIRLPVHIQGDLRRVKRSITELGRTPGARLTIETVARHSGMTSKRVNYLLNGLPTVDHLESLVCWQGSPLSVHKTRQREGRLPHCEAWHLPAKLRFLMTSDDDFELPPCLVRGLGIRGRTPCEFFELQMWASTHADAPGSSALGERRAAILSRMFASLSPREARILKMRYGFGGRDALTLDQIGRKFGLTRERIRQIEAGAIKRLRHAKRSQQLEDCLP